MLEAIPTKLRARCLEVSAVFLNTTASLIVVDPVKAAAVIAGVLEKTTLVLPVTPLTVVP